MGQKPPNEASHVTESEQPATGAGRSKVSHVTGVSAEEAKEIVTGAWDDVRAAFRIPDAERQSDEKYTTASGRLFDLIGEVLRDAVSRGEEQAPVSYEEARDVVSRDVVPPENVLASNYFSKLMGQWKRGESAARGDRVGVDQIDGRHALRVKCGGRDEVILTLLGPRETDRRQKPNRPAAIRWSINRGGAKLVVQSPGTPAEEPVTPMFSRDAAGASESPVTNHSLLSVGVQDAHQAFDRIEASTKSPYVRAHVRQLRKVLRALARIASVVVIVFGLSYFLSPPLRASVDTFVQATAARIERWWRLTIGPFFVGVRGVPIDGSPPVYRDVSSEWFAGFREIVPDPPPVTGEPSDKAQRERAEFAKSLIRKAGGDPGSVFSIQLSWRGGIRVAAAPWGGATKLRMLAVPSEANQRVPVTYAWGVMDVPLEFVGKGVDPAPGQQFPAKVEVGTLPHVEMDIADPEEVRVLRITLVMIPTALLEKGQKEIARDCEIAELLVFLRPDAALALQLPDGWRRDITFK